MGRSAHEALVGRTIAGKFLVEAPIGAGAMGAVFRARQIALEKTVAIKVLHGEHAGDASFVARFQREAKAASRLNHPNSMQVIDFGAEPDGLLYIAMEYLDGRSLHRVLRDEGPLDSARIVDILMQTLAALAVAHDMGVVHRDLKPDNIVILSRTDDDGRPKDIVKVCDFGIAKISDSRAYRDGPQRTSDAPLTAAGLMVGTPEYMSPEQGSGIKLDARSDLYSVGVILFEMLTGRVPFETENAIGTILKHINELPPRPSEIAPNVDPRLEVVCLRALRKHREERFADAREMRAELRAALQAPVAGELAGQLPGRVRVMTAQGASMDAPTVGFAMPAALEPPPKATLVGTASTVPRARKPARAIVVGASAALAVGAGALLFVVRGHRPAAAVAPAPQSAGLPAPVPVAPPVEIAPRAPVESAAPAGGKPSPATVGPTRAETRTTAVAQDPKKAPARMGAAALAATAPQAAPSPGPTVPPVNAPPVVPPVTASAQPSEAPPPAAAPAPASTVAEAADPSFDPDHGYVEVGLIDGMGVGENAVRGLLHGVELSGCYKNALRAKGSRTTGVATLNLVFDGSGVVRSAILSDAQFLPGMIRCIQASATGMRVPASQMSAPSATAEAWLAFKVR